MARDNITDILAFLAVARERSFTRAAAKLGVSQSALSHTVRGLEARLGVRLLTRTTAACRRPKRASDWCRPSARAMEEIEAEIAAVSDLADRPMGTIRITAIDPRDRQRAVAASGAVLDQYPDVHVEMSSDYRMVDVAADRFDIGVRYGDQSSRTWWRCA